VADLAARICFEAAEEKPAWELLSGRPRKRFRERAKH
jgi:hypothetical protein